MCKSGTRSRATEPRSMWHLRSSGQSIMPAASWFVGSSFRALFIYSFIHFILPFSLSLSLCLSLASVRLFLMVFVVIEAIIWNMHSIFMFVIFTAFPTHSNYFCLYYGQDTPRLSFHISIRLCCRAFLFCYVHY